MCLLLQYTWVHATKAPSHPPTSPPPPFTTSSPWPLTDSLPLHVLWQCNEALANCELAAILSWRLWAPSAVLGSSLGSVLPYLFVLQQLLSEASTTNHVQLSEFWLFISHFFHSCSKNLWLSNWVVSKSVLDHLGSDPEVQLLKLTAATWSFWTQHISELTCSLFHWCTLDDFFVSKPLNSSDPNVSHKLNVGLM